MVYGHEESDFAIVAVKPANKVAHPAVEQSAMGPTSQTTARTAPVMNAASIG